MNTRIAGQDRWPVSLVTPEATAKGDKDTRKLGKRQKKGPTESNVANAAIRGKEENYSTQDRFHKSVSESVPEICGIQEHKRGRQIARNKCRSRTLAGNELPRLASSCCTTVRSKGRARFS
jgi:hypothetical protein